LAGIVALLLTPFIALAIVLDTGSPVLLRQVRVGLRGEPFMLHKFRTMRVDAEEPGQPRWATPHDERVTRVGRILRRTRLDELPQLWDVLRGNMSLIGPRPERPEFVEQLARELPLYRARSLVRPGITGWAQVQYPYAETIERNLSKLEYDLYYIRHLGLLLDIAILLRTLPAVIAPVGVSDPGQPPRT
jgi:lipopolysaccharide/colanic/teichoic acid biosynthesis glycosyltransferase